MSESPTCAYGAVVERDHCATTTLRRARKAHPCDSCQSATVQPGEAYLLHTAFPGHDVDGGNWTRPQRLVECQACATRYGRGGLLPSANDDGAAQ